MTRPPYSVRKSAQHVEVFVVSFGLEFVRRSRLWIATAAAAIESALELSGSRGDARTTHGAGRGGELQRGCPDDYRDGGQ